MEESTWAHPCTLCRCSSGQNIWSSKINEKKFSFPWSIRHLSCLSSQPSSSYWPESIHFNNSYCVRVCGMERKTFISQSLQRAYNPPRSWSWVSTLSSSFCLIQSPHNGRGPHFSLLPYLGKLLQWQSNVLKPGDGSPHVWWAPREAQFVLSPSPVQSPHTTHVLLDMQKESRLWNKQLLCKFSMSCRFWKVHC